MSDKFTITTDTSRLIAALDAFPDLLAAKVNEVARLTADRIAAEARGRAKRRTGDTARGVTSEEARDGRGYVVYVGDGQGHVGKFLEFGTKFMDARPFLFASARLEEAGHDRRVRAAIDGVLRQKGLGD